MSFWAEPDEINAALKTGKVSVLKQAMNSTVELVILEKENVYSKIQAEQILKQFFQTHQPISFTVLHNGGSDNSQYYIGNLKTQKGTYRVYYLLKTKEKETLLYQLRIENDE
jgi:hypothetical protein